MKSWIFVSAVFSALASSGALALDISSITSSVTSTIGSINSGIIGAASDITACTSAATSLATSCSSSSVKTLVDGGLDSFFTNLQSGLTASDLNTLCNSQCLTAVQNTTQTCVNALNYISNNNLPIGTVPSSINTLKTISATLCTKDTSGNYCALQLAKAYLPVETQIKAAISSAAEGTAITADIKSALSGVCGECTKTLISQVSTLANSFGVNNVASLLGTVDLVCNYDYTTANKCLNDIGTFVKNITSGNANDAVATAKQLICQSSDPCIGTAGATIRRYANQALLSVNSALPIFTNPDLCSINLAENVCFDAVADVLSSVPACASSLSGVSVSSLDCSTLSTQCTSVLNKIANAGCCATVVADSIGGTVRDVLLKAVSSCANGTTPQCVSSSSVDLSYSVKFPVTIPNLDLTKLTNSGLLQSVNASLIKDIASRLNVPFTSVNITAITSAVSGGVTVTVSVNFATLVSKANAQTAVSGLKAALSATVTTIGSSDVLINSNVALVADFPSALSTDGTSTADGSDKSGASMVVANAVAAVGAAAIVASML